MTEEQREAMWEACNTTRRNERVRKEDIYPEAEEDEDGAGGPGGEEIPPYDACFQF